MLIWAYKFQYKRDLASMFANLLANVPIDGDVITWVPSAPPRMRQRGFDHAQLLARHLSKKTSLPHRKLINRTNNSEQVGSSRAQRIANARQSYQLRAGVHIKGQHVVLVDDVISTGSTVSVCAKLLKRAGAASVTVVVVAINLN